MLGQPLRALPLGHQRAVALSSAADAALWVAVAAYSGSIFTSEYLARGWLNPNVHLRVGPSSVAGAGRGVFAAANLPAATILGHYPGMLLSPMRYEQKRLACPAAASYCWLLDDSRALDPTDARGVLLEPLPRCSLGGGRADSLLGTVPTTLALINEPGVGLDVNVVSEQRGSTLLFGTARDIVDGEELFLDYGPLYDRSTYGRSPM